MWGKSKNANEDRPAVLERCRDIMIVRRGFRMIEETEEEPAHWEWEEWQMTADQYEVYLAMQSETADLSDALIELADIIAGGM